MQAVAPRRRRALGACSVQGHCSSGTGEVSGRGRPVWKPAMISRSVTVPVASSLSSNGDSHPLSRHGLLRADSAAARQQYYSFMQGLASRSAGVPGGGRRARKGVMVQEWPGPDGCEAVDEGLHLVPRAVLGQPVRPRPELLGGGQARDGSLGRAVDKHPVEVQSVDQLAARQNPVRGGGGGGCAAHRAARGCVTTVIRTHTLGHWMMAPGRAGGYRRQHAHGWAGMGCSWPAANLATAGGPGLAPPGSFCGCAAVQSARRRHRDATVHCSCTFTL